MSMFQALPPAIRISTEEEARSLVARLRDTAVLAFDTETTGLSRTRDYAIILSLSDGVDRWAIWPQAMPYFADLLENPNLKLIGHNSNFDQWMLLNIGIDLNRHMSRSQCRVIDTMVMHALLDSEAMHDLKYLSKHYLNIDMVPFKHVFGRQMRTRTLVDVLLDPDNEDVVCNYAALDAYATYKLFLKLQAELRRTLISSNIGNGTYKNMWEYYLRSEVPFTKVLWNMERRGVKVDVDKLLEKGPELELEALQIQGWFMKKLRRYSVNLNSIPEMSKLFFETFGRVPLGLTAGGAPQLSKVALKKWAAAGCEYAAQLLRYRDLIKQLGTYVVNLSRQVFTDGRIHTTYNQTGARTGRLASRDPNLQNQPPLLRDVYIPEAGFMLRAYDYAQLEVRLTAHLSGETVLIDAIKHGKDIHAATAATIYSIPYEDIMHAKEADERGEALSDHDKDCLKKRKFSKTITFGILYGMGPGKLATSLGISLAEARKTIDDYFEALPNVPAYFAKAIEDAKQRGFCTTIMGRRRQVRGLWSFLRSEVKRAERMVKNTPIQGTGNEVVKGAMIRIENDEVLAANNVRMLLQVHDELVFEIPTALIHNVEIHERIKNHMSNGLGFMLSVPLDTDGKPGHTWAECK